MSSAVANGYGTGKARKLCLVRTAYSCDDACPRPACEFNRSMTDGAGTSSHQNRPAVDRSVGEQAAVRCQRRDAQ